MNIYKLTWYRACGAVAAVQTTSLTLFDSNKKLNRKNLIMHGSFQNTRKLCSHWALIWFAVRTAFGVLKLNFTKLKIAHGFKTLETKSSELLETRIIDI
jgi:hypothetical protein